MAPTRLAPVCFFLLVAALAPQQVAAVDTSWRAAVTTVDITPKQALWMGGYAARTKPAEGAVHPLNAKVLVLEDNAKQRLVIVTLDLLGITPEMRDQVEQGAQQLGIPPASLLLNASHTHCGPELRDERIIRFGIDAKYAAFARKYVQDTCTQVNGAIAASLKKLRPAQLEYSHARAGFAMNRRLPTKKGFINSPNPDGPVDHTIPVLSVKSASDDLMAVMFGYACHNTTLSFNQWCGDYCGFAQIYIEEKHPGAVAMFVNGCSADQNPYPRRTVELAQQHGRALANGVETALETKAKRQVGGPLKLGLKNVALDFDNAPTKSQLEDELKSSNKYARFHAQWLLDQLKQQGEIPTRYEFFPVQTLEFGKDLTIIAICGETVVDYSLRLKRELAEGHGAVWVAGYSNHVFGYLPSLRVLREGGYEGGGAMRYTSFPGKFAESVEERIVSAIFDLLKK